MTCTTEFVNAKNKRKRNVLQGPLQFILKVSIRFANLIPKQHNHVPEASKPEEKKNYEKQKKINFMP